MRAAGATRLQFRFLGFFFFLFFGDLFVFLFFGFSKLEFRVYPTLQRDFRDVGVYLSRVYLQIILGAYLILGVLSPDNLDKPPKF